MAKKLVPLKGWVHLQPGEKETKTKGGIYIPEPSQQRNPHGTILSVGPDVEEVKEGDQVMYLKNTGLEQEDGSLLTKIDNVIAIL